MQQALKTMEGWCRKKNLSVNPDKTELVPFTKRRKLEELKFANFFETQLHQSGEVGYLGIILDQESAHAENC